MTTHAASHARRVLLTRTTPENDAWAAALAGLGVASTSIVCVEISPDPGADEALAERRDATDVWAFASPRAVAYEQGRSTSGRIPSRLAAVGPSTADALRRRYGRCDLVSEEGRARSLIDALLTCTPRPRSVTWLGSANGATGDLARLRIAGIDAAAIGLYRVTPRACTSAADVRDLRGEDLDAVFLASPSAWKGLRATTLLPPAVPLVTIGPTTSDAVRAAGATVFAESRSRDPQGMLAAWREALDARGPS